MYCCYVCKARYTDREECKQHMSSHKRRKTNDDAQDTFNTTPIGNDDSQIAIEEVKREDIAVGIKGVTYEPVEEHNDLYLTARNTDIDKCEQNVLSYWRKEKNSNDGSKFETKTFDKNSCSQEVLEEIKCEEFVVEIKDEIKDEPIWKFEDNNDLRLAIIDNLHCSNVTSECKQHINIHSYKGNLDKYQGMAWYHKLSINQYMNNIVKKRKYQSSYRIYECSYCDKVFSQKSILDCHILMHNGLKRYECSYCDRVFAQKSVFKRHIRIHIGEKPYRCILCRKTFSPKTDLYGHMKTHTWKMPYQCNHCDQTFTMMTCNINGTFYTPCEELTIGVLPTKRNILECMLYLLLPLNPWCQISINEASEILARKLIRHWGFANMYTKDWQYVSKCIAKLFCDARNNSYYITSKKKKPSEQWKKAFNTDMKRLFDIFDENESAGCKMKKTDYDFLYDMRGERKMCCENFFGLHWKTYYEQMLKEEKHPCGHQKYIQSRLIDNEKHGSSYREEVLVEVSESDVTSPALGLTSIS